jgi:pyrroline-5-carboxylate reductase
MAIVRTMPNIAALIGAGATGMYANGLVSENERSIAESIFRSVGLVAWVQHENELDIVTALSGSGPAYIFYFMEAMEHAAVKLGLPQDIARLLVIQTALGASKLVLEQSVDPAILRQQVTVPKGTTQAAISHLDSMDVSLHIEQAVKYACERAREIEAEVVEQLRDK